MGRGPKNARRHRDRSAPMIAPEGIAAARAAASTLVGTIIGVEITGYKSPASCLNTSSFISNR